MGLIAPFAHPPVHGSDGPEVYSKHKKIDALFFDEFFHFPAEILEGYTSNWLFCPDLFTLIGFNILAKTGRGVDNALCSPPSSDSPKLFFDEFFHFLAKTMQRKAHNIKIVSFYSLYKGSTNSLNSITTSFVVWFLKVPSE